MSAFESYMSKPSDDGEVGPFFQVPADPPKVGEILKNQTHPDKAVTQVYRYVSSRLEKTDAHVSFTREDVYVVSFTYILGGWKAMVSTTLPDGMYYEVTYNRTKAETYVDAYKKWDNVCVSDDEVFAP